MQKLLLLSAAFLLISVACKKEEEAPLVEPTPVTPTEVKTGSIIGKVNLYDAFGVQLDSTAGTATVKIEETGQSVNTDSKGNFSLTSVKAGTYTIVYSKLNFGTIKAQGIIYKVGDKGNYDANIAQLPAYSLSSALVKDTTWFTGTSLGLYYRTYSAETNSASAAVAIISSTPNPSIANPNSYQYDMPVSLLNKPNDYSRFVSYTFLKDNYEIAKNTTLYVKIYPVASKASFYTDLKLKRPVYTAYGTEFAQTFTILTK